MRLVGNRPLIMRHRILPIGQIAFVRGIATPIDPDGIAMAGEL